MKKTLLLTALVLMFSISHAHASNCAPGDKFNSNTGLPCTFHECAPGDLFSSVTGKPCATLSVNQPTIMENQVTQSPSSESATVPPVTLPIISSSHANNRNQTLSVKTNVPTTLTVEYFDYSPILNSVTPSWSIMAPLILSAVSDPSQVSTYTDSALTADHEISYANFTLTPNDFYCYKVTATDANGNTAVQTFNQSWGGDNIGTFNWSFSDEISTNKNG